MAITFHPRHCTVLYCDFHGLIVPEMIKKRPVVILSTKHAGLCVVVPLSGTAPEPVEAHHHKMNRQALPKKLRDKGDWWAKCDCLTHVCFERLDRIQDGRDPRTGRRCYISPRIAEIDLKAIKICIVRYLGMSDLISV